MRQGQAIFANFICKFGEKNLLDYLQEIVLPAFLLNGQRRVWGKTSYHLLGVVATHVNVDGSERPVIHGRFVKDTSLVRTQVLLPSGDTRRDIQAIQSSPSAFFVLFLDDHRLIYYGETPDSPDLQAFSSASQYFLRNRWAIFTENEYRAKTVTRARIKEDHPAPKVSIVPIASGDSIRDFISKYSIITKLEITILERNAEIDYSVIMENLRQFGSDVGSPVTQLIESNKNGLIAPNVADALEGISMQGNQNFAVTGKDKSGNTLKGDNEDFSLKTQIEALPEDQTQRVNVLARKLADTVKQGLIKIPPVATDFRDRLNRILREFKQ